MLDAKQERLLKLENFAKERGLSQDEFKKMLTYFIERHGEDGNASFCESSRCF